MGNSQVPTHGYIFASRPQYYEYRSTALAYMEREGLTTVSNKDGKTYTIEQLKDAIIGYKK